MWYVPSLIRHEDDPVRIIGNRDRPPNSPPTDVDDRDCVVEHVGDVREMVVRHGDANREGADDNVVSDSQRFGVNDEDPAVVRTVDNERAAVGRRRYDAEAGRVTRWSEGPSGEMPMPSVCEILPDWSRPRLNRVRIELRQCARQKLRTERRTGPPASEDRRRSPAPARCLQSR